MLLESKNTSEDIPDEPKEYPDAPLDKDKVSDNKDYSVEFPVVGHPQKEDQGYVDSGCSRHMTGNISYLFKFKEFDGGYVTFWGGANSGRITEQQIQALVDKKKVIITETSVRNDLHLEDAEGIECLPTATIFEQLTLIGKQKSKKSKKRITEVPQLSDSTHDVADKHVTITSNDPLLSANQALEIESLKRRVKKLEKKANKKTHKLKRLYKIGFLTRVESSEDAGLDDQEDASKQRRVIANLDADEGVTLVDETQGRNDQDMFDTRIFDDEEVVAEEVVAEKEVSTPDPVTTAGEVVTTAGVEVSTAAITS
uniref:Putative ribonuclease H-like domain-containing protein n=1 Tax=Tanacetum cinerariifolium TaxID=118510 RepID=A0A699HB19_TANCI|nr:putative ribonuclease H-like domain-containing protein [Tanacetum cinerariifolium]